MIPDYPTPAALWQAALADLRLRLTRATYDAWLQDSQVWLPASNQQQLVVAVRSPYAPAWLSQRLGTVIAATLTDLTGRPLPITFITHEDIKKGGQPASLSPLLTATQQGESPMTTQPTTTQTQLEQTLSPAATRVRIYSHVTQARFLHIEDTLAIGKLRFFGGSYERGEGMSAHVTCFVDTADARVILTALCEFQRNCIKTENSSVTV